MPIRIKFGCSRCSLPWTRDISADIYYCLRCDFFTTFQEEAICSHETNMMTWIVIFSNYFFIHSGLKYFNIIFVPFTRIFHSLQCVIKISSFPLDDKNWFLHFYGHPSLRFLSLGITVNFTLEKNSHSSGASREPSHELWRQKGLMLHGHKKSTSLNKTLSKNSKLERLLCETFH